MHDSDAVERWLTQAFAQVEAPPGVQAWRDLNPGPAPVRNGARRLRAIGLMAGIVAVLFTASVAGTLALTHSHPSTSATGHASSVPGATHTASSSAPAGAAACSRLQTSVSPMKGMQFDPPGAADPAISCARAIAILLCPPHGWNGPCRAVHGLPVKAQLARLNAVGPMGEVRGPALPWAGSPFLPKNLLVWDLTFVPTVCTRVNGNIVSGSFPDFNVLLTVRVDGDGCRITRGYLIDASTGAFVYFDSAQLKAS